MSQALIYEDLKGRKLSLVHLDAQERKLVAALIKRAGEKADWMAFDNYRMAAVAAFYDARGMPRKVSSQTTAYQVGQDLSSRMAIATGMARLGNYRDDLEAIIREGYGSQRAFCAAAGLSEDMLSHVLKGRKDLSLEVLTEALNRVGYMVRLVPKPELTAPARKRPRNLPSTPGKAKKKQVG